MGGGVGWALFTIMGKKREPCILGVYGNGNDLSSWSQGGVGIQFQLLSCGSDTQLLISSSLWTGDHV